MTIDSLQRLRQSLPLFQSYEVRNVYAASPLVVDWRPADVAKQSNACGGGNSLHQGPIGFQKISR